MGDHTRILPPADKYDKKGAQRVFEEFFVLYEPTFVELDSYLAKVIEEAGPYYADAYKPWHKALQDLFQGVYLMARKIPLPNAETFRESLLMFSFESAIQFLSDLCISCHRALQHNWAQRFQEHINILLFSFSILNRGQQLAHR